MSGPCRRALPLRYAVGWHVREGGPHAGSGLKRASRPASGLGLNAGESTTRWARRQRGSTCSAANGKVHSRLGWQAVSAGAGLRTTRTPAPPISAAASLAPSASTPSTDAPAPGGPGTRTPRSPGRLARSTSGSSSGLWTR